jgi:hypothetical protein
MLCFVESRPEVRTRKPQQGGQAPVALENDRLPIFVANDERLRAEKPVSGDGLGDNCGLKVLVDKNQKVILGQSPALVMT